MALFILPSELLLEIVHLSDSGTQKSLSLTSRNLLGLAQKRLFNCFHLALLDETTNEGDDLFIHLISRIDGIIQDERLSSYISSLEFEPKGRRDMVIHPRLILAVERLFDGIDRFVALMNLKFIHMHISCTMATRLMSFITFHALKITLGFCSYPGDEWRFPEDDTRLTKLSLFHSEASIPTEPFIIHLLERSCTNLKELVLIGDERPSISSLPCPLHTLVNLTIGCHMPEAQAFCGFLVQNPTIEELDFWGLQDVSPLPATALPALRFLGAPSEWVGVLVPGRPLASVHIHTNAEPHDVRQLQYSTRPITDLTLRTSWALQELIVETFVAMVTSTPHLQIFTLVFLEQVGASTEGL